MITFIVFHSRIQQLKTDENWVNWHNWHWKANQSTMPGSHFVKSTTFTIAQKIYTLN